MKSLISRFLAPKKIDESAQQIRLCLARFQHLLRQYGQIVALCADAEDKQSGQYIFDNAYTIAMIDRAFEAAEAMIYDLNALTDQRYLGLYENVEAIRHETTNLFKVDSAPPPVTGNEEEPEYRLLRNVRKALCRPEGPVTLAESLSGISGFFGVLLFILQSAGESMAHLTQSMQFPRSPAGTPSGALSAVSTSVVDLLSLLGGSRVSLPESQSISADSVPTREFLAAFFSPSIWENDPPGTAVPPAANLVACQLEEAMQTVIVHGGGYDLFNVFLGWPPESNYIYCRFPRGPASALAEGVLAKLGFVVSSTERWLNGWTASEPVNETTTKLQMVAKLSAFLLRSSSMPVTQIEEDVNRFIGMPA
jgi:hypothetical protein